MSPLARRMKLPFLICTFLFPLSLSLSLFLWFSFLFHHDLIESRDFLFCSKAKLYTFFIAGSIKFLKHKEHQRRDREKTNKIINRSATVNAQLLHKLVWVFFSSNYVKLTTFSILHNYAQNNVIAFKIANINFSLLKLFNAPHIPI